LSIAYSSLISNSCQLDAEVKRAPFEVSETGWGEFEASIRIFFKDPDERPLDLFHLIKLYPPGPPQLSGSLKKVTTHTGFSVVLLFICFAVQPAPVVAEQYDEIVFNEPTEPFMQQLMAYSSRESKPLAPLQIVRRIHFAVRMPVSIYR